MSTKHRGDHHGRERARRVAASPAQQVAATSRDAARSCGWCGRSLTVAATGRIPKWCSHACRQRAWEQKRAAESGRCAVTVVERVVTVPAPSGAAERRDWPALLDELAHDLDRGRLYRRDLPALTAALEQVLAAYRRAIR